METMVANLIIYTTESFWREYEECIDKLNMYKRNKIIATAVKANWHQQQNLPKWVASTKRKVEMAADDVTIVHAGRWPINTRI